MNIPNTISISRVGILFIFLPLIYYGNIEMKIAAIVLCPVMFLMDYLDGYFARKLNMTTQIGSFFDLVGDRITEIVFWIFFFSLGMVPWWAPTIIILRGFLSDWTRFRAKSSGKTVYGMMKSPICKFLVCSRIMRGLYGSMKMVLFTLLSIQFVFSPGLENIIFYLIVLVISVNLIRGLPVIYDGRKYLFKNSL